MRELSIILDKAQLIHCGIVMDLEPDKDTVISFLVEHGAKRFNCTPCISDADSDSDAGRGSL
jgi:hypothetical protein